MSAEICHDRVAHAPESTDHDGGASPFMSMAEVAAYFGRTTRTILNWERRGLLTPRRIGRSKFYRRHDIEMLGDEPQDAEMTPGQTSKNT